MLAHYNEKRTIKTFFFLTHLHSMVEDIALLLRIFDWGSVYHTRTNCTHEARKGGNFMIFFLVTKRRPLGPS